MDDYKKDTNMSAPDNEDDAPENEGDTSPPTKLTSTLPKLCTTIVESDALGVARMSVNSTDSTDNYKSKIHNKCRIFKTTEGVIIRNTRAEHL